MQEGLKNEGLEVELTQPLDTEIELLDDEETGDAIGHEISEDEDAEKEISDYDDK